MVWLGKRAWESKDLRCLTSTACEALGHHLKKSNSERWRWMENAMKANTACPKAGCTSQVRYIPTANCLNIHHI